MIEQAIPSTMSMASASYNQYPTPKAKYEEVVADRQLFMLSLEKLHSVMGTKFMIPIIGGMNVDLHKLFVEVTSRGGIEEVIREKRWREVTSTFNFPAKATNASFALRKYYYSLLQHFERIYYLKVGPPSTDALGSSNAVHSAVTAATASSAGTSVIGVIDGKFDSGYLVTVVMGNETLKGTLYQTPV